MTIIRLHQLLLLPPATKLGQGNIFRSVCPHSVHGGGHAWLLRGGACVVAPGGCAWLLLGGMCGCSGGCAWLLQGGGHAWDTTRYGDTVNERAVRILLECILIFKKFQGTSKIFAKIDKCFISKDQFTLAVKVTIFICGTFGLFNAF